MFIANLCAYAKTALPDDDDVEIVDAPDRNLQHVLQLAGIGTKEKAPTVNVQEKLDKAGLGDVYPVDMWPDMSATRQLATWVRNAKKHFGKNAYVFVDFKRCFSILSLSCLRFFTCYLGFSPLSARIVLRVQKKIKHSRKPKAVVELIAKRGV